MRILKLNQKEINIIFLIILLLIVGGVVIYVPGHITMCWTGMCGELYHLVLFVQFLFLIPIIFTPHLFRLLIILLYSKCFFLNMSICRGAVQSEKNLYKFLTPTLQSYFLTKRITYVIIN